MKSLLNSLLVIAVLFIFVSSCKKNSTTTHESIIGKWNIQKDSTSIGVGSNNHLMNYDGKSGDYFNFSTDGHLYTNENSILDTLNYTINSDSIMILNFGYEGGVGKGLILFLSTHSLIISSGYLNTPGGVFGRTVYLYR